MPDKEAGRRRSALQSPHFDTARQFVAYVSEGPIPSLAALSRCVDALALSLHDTPPGDPHESEDGLPGHLQVSHDQVGARFPDLGYYATVFGIDLPGEALVGDAIDDMMDIANDLQDVLWRLDAYGIDDANWHLRMLYEIHWGYHLRGLQRYLYWVYRNALDD